MSISCGSPPVLAISPLGAVSVKEVSLAEVSMLVVSDAVMEPTLDTLPGSPAAPVVVVVVVVAPGPLDMALLDMEGD